MTTNYTPEQLSHWQTVIQNADSRLVEHAGGMTEKACMFITKMIEEKYLGKSTSYTLDFASREMVVSLVVIKTIVEDVIFLENLKGYLKLDGWDIKVRGV